MKAVIFLACCLLTPTIYGDTFIRFKVHEPLNSDVHFVLGGFIHKVPWYLPKGRFPADKSDAFRTGEWTPWFNVSEWAGDRLHGEMKRGSGIGEHPNMTIEIRCSVDHPRRELEIELATAADSKAVKKRFSEAFTGSKTSVLVSPNLENDAELLETASEMSGRRLSWAKAASGGRRVSPRNHILQTSLWAPQREELQRMELQTLSLLGFNVVGNQGGMEGFPELRVPGHSHRVDISPGATREDIAVGLHDELKKKNLPGFGVPFGFKDEICARPRIGANAQARKHLHDWLADQSISPRELGVIRLEDVVPLETPEALKEAMAVNEAAARRVFYYTSIFRQKAGTDRLRWNTETYHQVVDNGSLTSTLVADHPYFGGTGLGMGMVPNTAWGGAPLALDWFDLTRRKAVDLIGIEDWLGLQYMYGPNYTWEGFQLMGFQAAMMRSGGVHGGELVPIIAWITPSNEENFRLKTASALAQGAKHFFFWTYGPSCTSTENYWSDIRGAHDGVATLARQLAFVEPIIHKGALRPAKIAILYSISSDLWQPFGYLHMLERRCAYLAMVHAQHRVDFITEDDIEAGRLDAYDVLWTSDPCIRTKSIGLIKAWTSDRKHRLIGTCGAGHFNEFGEPVDALAEVFGFERDVDRLWTVQSGNYRVRGGLNGIRLLHEDESGLEWIGLDGAVKPEGARVRKTFKDGSAAELICGNASYFLGSPAVSYAKAAQFVPPELAENWPKEWRARLLQDVQHIVPPVRLSEPVVECGLYESKNAAALVFGNFTYSPIKELVVDCEVGFPVSKVSSAEEGHLVFSQESGRLQFTIPLGISEIVRVE